jgi:endonuclease/exonuclease/phosphatase family metal-dependent hydrolase
LLQTFFAERNYCMICINNGNQHSGYMGPAIAFSRSLFDLVAVKQYRISDTKCTPWPRHDFSRRSFVQAAYRYSWNNLLPPLIKSWVPSWFAPHDSWDEWDQAEARNNPICGVQLCRRLREGDAAAAAAAASPIKPASPFWVFNVHMPCLFRTERDVKALAIHCALVGQHVQRTAGAAPFVLAGDFNVKPRDDNYALLTCGALPAESRARPCVRTLPMSNGQPAEPDRFECKIPEGMRSAYALALGREPDFTNHALTDCSVDGVPFTDTLDYIFLSKHWSVESVRQLPPLAAATRAACGPNSDEPSDHLLIGADLAL